jgi:hypothetical protein
MPTLTTTDGSQFTFAADAVVAVADHDADTGAAVTCVYGVTAGVLKIGETVAGFIARIGETAHFAQLTRPDGSSVWISGPAVSALRSPLPGEYAPGVQTVVTAGSLTQGVTQGLLAAKTVIDAHGGKL